MNAMLMHYRNVLCPVMSSLVNYAYFDVLCIHSAYRKDQSAQVHQLVVKSLYQTSKGHPCHQGSQYKLLNKLQLSLKYQIKAFHHLLYLYPYRQWLVPCQMLEVQLLVSLEMSPQEQQERNSNRLPSSQGKICSGQTSKLLR